MNCDEFQQLLMSEPNHSNSDAEQHKQVCKVCAEFSEQVLVFDSHLNHALEIPVPDSLKIDWNKEEG